MDQKPIIVSEWIPSIHHPTHDGIYQAHKGNENYVQWVRYVAALDQWGMLCDTVNDARRFGLMRNTADFFYRVVLDKSVPGY